MLPVYPVVGVPPRVYMPGMVSVGYAQYRAVRATCSSDKEVKEARRPSQKGPERDIIDIIERFLLFHRAIP